MTATANRVSALDASPMPSPRGADVIPHPAVMAHPAAPALTAAANRAAAAEASTDRATALQRRELMGRLIAPILGVLAFIAIWAGVAQMGSIPGPAKTWTAAMEVFSDPFYEKGPNDQGIGWKIGGSL